jgi:hypothetical protein
MENLHVFLLVIIVLLVIVVFSLLLSRRKKMHYVRLVSDCDQTKDKEMLEREMSTLVPAPEISRDDAQLATSLGEDALGAHNTWAGKYKGSGLNIINRHQTRENPLFAAFNWTATGRAPRIIRKGDSDQLTSDATDEEIEEFNNAIKNRAFSY